MLNITISRLTINCDVCVIYQKNCFWFYLLSVSVDVDVHFCTFVSSEIITGFTQEKDDHYQGADDTHYLYARLTINNEKIQQIVIPIAPANVGSVSSRGSFL